MLIKLQKQPRLFDVWEVTDEMSVPRSLPWRVQLVGYVGQFPTREDAEMYVTRVKEYRAKFGKTPTNMQEVRTGTASK